MFFALRTTDGHHGDGVRMLKELRVVTGDKRLSVERLGIDEFDICLYLSIIVNFTLKAPIGPSGERYLQR